MIEGATEAPTETSPTLDPEAGVPRFWENGVVALQGFPLGIFDDNENVRLVDQWESNVLELHHPWQDSPNKWAVYVPACDSSMILVVKGTNVDPDDAVLVTMLKRPVTCFGRSRQPVFDCSSPLTSSERLKYLQMIPQRLEALIQWPMVWTRQIEDKSLTAKLSESGVRIVSDSLGRRIFL